MPTQPLTLAKARAAVAACDKALREGHPAPSKANGRTGRSALNAAAAALGVPRETLEKRLRRARELHGLLEAIKCLLEKNTQNTQSEKDGERETKQRDTQREKVRRNQ